MLAVKTCGLMLQEGKVQLVWATVLSLTSSGMPGSEASAHLLVIFLKNSLM